MSQFLKSAVIHKLEKEPGQSSTLVEAATPLDVTEDPLQALVNQVHEVYAGRESKSHGQFDPLLTPVSAEPHLRSLRDDPAADFLAVSHQLMRVLKAKADGENFATGGHVLFADSSAGGIRWFIVVILNNKAGTTINEQLKVIRAPHLDVEGIRFAGRVNLTSWLAQDTTRYISFLKGKRNDVSVYFQKFLGCSTVQKDLNDTRNLVSAVKLFALAQGLDEAQKETLLKEVNQFASSKATSKEPLVLSELANRVWPTDPESLKVTFAAADPPIADGFIPMKRGLDGLTRFNARASKWKLEFDREAIQDQTILFDETERTLLIRDLPADIISSLRREFSTDAPAADLTE